LVNSLLEECPIRAAFNISIIIQLNVCLLPEKLGTVFLMTKTWQLQRILVSIPGLLLGIGSTFFAYAESKMTCIIKPTINLW